ncbi:hypothetical protein C0Q70_01507 [Pomacea canaliculata]|uniref:Uncharacterized protein n=1 Tax=Pomacea canaliculata TaxID=400727 RepID=A0A2T7PZN6_POMCA|nr:hypothetical protein C0Q70_01507 [Pomacea canaliculata]
MRRPKASIDIADIAAHNGPQRHYLRHRQTLRTVGETSTQSSKVVSTHTSLTDSRHAQQQLSGQQISHLQLLHPENTKSERF